MTSSWRRKFWSCHKKYWLRICTHLMLLLFHLTYETLLSHRNLTRSDNVDCWIFFSLKLSIYSTASAIFVALNSEKSLWKLRDVKARAVAQLGDFEVFCMISLYFKFRSHLMINIIIEIMQCKKYWEGKFFLTTHNSPSLLRLQSNQSRRNDPQLPLLAELRYLLVATWICMVDFGRLSSQYWCINLNFSGRFHRPQYDSRRE